MNRELTEIALSASKAFGPLDTSLLLMNVDATDQNIEGTDTEGSAYSMIQVRLGYNF